MAKNKEWDVPPYSPKTLQLKKLKSYTDQCKSGEYTALERIFATFSNSSTYKFYDGVNGKNPSIEDLK